MSSFFLASTRRVCKVNVVSPLLLGDENARERESSASAYGEREGEKMRAAEHFALLSFVFIFIQHKRSWQLLLIFTRQKTLSNKVNRSAGVYTIYARCCKQINCGEARVSWRFGGMSFQHERFSRCLLRLRLSFFLF